MSEQSFLGRHSGVVVNTLASQQEGPGFNSQVRTAFLCGVCAFSSCLCGVSSEALWFSPQSKTWLVIQSLSLSKSTNDDLHLVTGCCTAALHCCAGEDVSNAENKFHLTCDL